MFCGNCGNKSVEGDRYCIRCGRERSVTSASQSLAAPLLEVPKPPSEMINAVKVATSVPAGDRTITAKVSLAKPAARPSYCRHSPAQRSAIGRYGQQGSDFCTGCRLPYAPGSPGSGVRPAVSPPVPVSVAGMKPPYCRHSPAERSRLGVGRQDRSDTCLGCKLPYAPGSPNSGLRSAASGTDQPHDLYASAYLTQSHARSAQDSLSLPQAVRAGLAKYFDFSSRARRSEFWWFELFFFITYFGAAVLDGVFNSGVVFLGLTFLGLYLPMLAVTVRRLHDTNRSGWFVLLQAIPLVGLAVLVFVCEDSGRGPNGYGPSPKYP
jgi:uncharacterized membrane protein YhaH (DUF805 family)